MLSKMGNNSNMRGGRRRDEDGELRQKRGDTKVRTLEAEYGINYGVNPEKTLADLRKRAGVVDIKDINRLARKGKL